MYRSLNFGPDFQNNARKNLFLNFLLVILMMKHFHISFTFISWHEMPQKHTEHSCVAHIDFYKYKSIESTFIDPYCHGIRRIRIGIPGNSENISKGILRYSSEYFRNTNFCLLVARESSASTESVEKFHWLTKPCAGSEPRTPALKPSECTTGTPSTSLVAF